MRITFLSGGQAKGTMDSGIAGAKGFVYTAYEFDAKKSKGMGNITEWKGVMKLTRTFNDLPEHVDSYKTIYVPPLANMRQQRNT